MLEPAPARHSKSKLSLCSRLLAAFTFSLPFSDFTFNLSPSFSPLPSSARALQGRHNGPCSVASSGFWAGGATGAAPNDHRTTALVYCLSTRSRAPPPPPQHTAQPATAARTCCGKSPPNNTSPCRGSP